MVGGRRRRPRRRRRGPRPFGPEITDDQARLIDKITAASASGAASLSDVKHIVILMQENRSFDHYFGTLSGVARFSDPNALPGVFDQHGYEPGVGVTAAGYTQPFNLQNNPPTENGYDTNDIDHSWGGQHNSWNSGAMNSFITSHLATDGDANGPVTMGYFTRSELPFYYALADAFTICDGYHCSVLGPTDPNRLMAFSAWIDPAGVAGGPVITTASDRLAMTGKLNWETMPEALQKAGVSWKVYGDPTGGLGLDVLPYFQNYSDPFSLTNLELIAKGITPTFPGNFQSDVKSGSLPSVSWIVPPLAECEHPAAPPEWGEYLVQQILNILVSNPDVWAQTVFIVDYDENGGFFDHVRRRRRPGRGTAGEYLTGTLPSSADGIAGPIGLGFRTPALVISPFSAGGYKYSGTLDHTSATPDRDQVRRHRAEPDRLAAVGHRRLHRRTQPDGGPGDRGPGAADDLARRERHRDRGSGAQRPHRHPGRRHRLPAPHQQRHAGSGDHPGPPQRPLKAKIKIRHIERTVTPPSGRR